MIGRQLDRYRLVEELGSGGMAVVYKGLDTSLDREVAVKVLHPHLASKEESRKRFSREARAVARLQHPSIVEIFDFSSDEAAESFIVTEYVRGCTLRVFGEEVGFGLPEIGVLIAERLAEALEHAHAAGVVHRDLKPENVMVRDDGALKLMDFGIARMVGQDERMTMTGAMVGSPLHMAPEVIEGRDAGEAADIFSLGTILYWLVTGRMAFEGNNTTQTLRRILEGEYPDPRTAAPATSDELAALIDRCLQRDPAQRFPSMAALRRALADLLAEVGIEAGPEALQTFFTDPAGTREAMRLGIVERLIERGQADLQARRPARALSAFNRVLALAPDEPRVLALLAGMTRKRVIRRRLLHASWLLGVLAIGGAGAWAFTSGSSGGEALDTPAPPLASIPREAEGEPSSAEADPLQGDGRGALLDIAERDLLEELTRRDREGSRAGEDEIAARLGGGSAAPSRRQPERTVATPPSPTPTQPAPAPAQAAKVPVHLRWVPQGAVLSIDGERKDTIAPSWSGELPVGRHRITLSHAECCEPLEEIVVLREGDEALQRSLVLSPRESGWFLVEADEPAAEVWLDGTFKGTVEEVNSRGGVAVGFSKDDAGRERYVKTVQFELLSPRGVEPRLRLIAEVDVRAGQRSRTRPLQLPRTAAAGAPAQDGGVR